MTFRLIITNIKKIIADHWPFSILIIIILTVLVVRAMPDNHMDFESAQSIIAARWWARDGFFKNYLLQLNPGYGKIARYFDDPALQAHAQGIVAGGLIGSRIYYTHYPSFYIIPTALLIKFRVMKLFFLRLFSIAASILALVFFYKFAALITNKLVSFWAVFYFGVSGIFIRWADTLGYTPIEDLWRFLILFLSFPAFLKISSDEDTNFKKLKWHFLTIWIAYIFLSLTSFNSTFFIFVWLIGLTGIYLRHSARPHKIRDFMIAVFVIGSAPVLGFAIQMIQNSAYLGWHNAWLDIYGTFLAGGNKVGLDFKTRMEGIIRPFFSATGLLNFYTTIIPFGLADFKKYFWPSSINTFYVLPPIVLIFTPIFIKLKNLTNYKIPTNFLILLGAAPLLQTFALPMIGYRDYIGRLAAPVLGIGIGIIFEMLYLFFKKSKDAKLIYKLINSTLFMFIIFLFAAQIITTIYYPHWFPYAPLSNGEINFSQQIQKTAPGEKAMFMINEKDTKVPEEVLLLRGPNALISPALYFSDYMIWKYYLDMPLLNFTKTSYLIKDLLYLENRSEFPFTAIVTSDDKKLISGLHQKLADKKLPLSEIKILDNRYFFTVSPIVKKDF